MVEITETDIDGIESEFEGFITFDKSRRQVLLDNTSFDVQACPGSGKTTLLAAKLMILSKKWKWSNEGVCVLSHTNVAKDEIIKQLKMHPSGWRFIEYPHFIGTIQEFVNKFLAIPFIKNKKHPIKSIDNDVYQKKCYSLSKYKTKKYIEMKFCSFLDLTTIWKNNKLSFKYPGFSKPSKSDSYKDLLSIKNYLIHTGYYNFREMYSFAEANLHQNSFLKDALKRRFKMVFIDEMQDTQKHQDELIEKIFPRNVQGPFIQRFGDDDQAIFDGLNEDSNDSFQSGLCKYHIDHSHRFSPCIAHLVKGLSFSVLDLKSYHACLNSGNHAECDNYGKNVIYVYDSDEAAKQIPKLYSDHVATVFSDMNRTGLKVMAVGAIGKKSEDNNHIRIDKYFKHFTKLKLSSTPKFVCLYECVTFAVQKSNPNVKDNYDLIFNCILSYLHEINVTVHIEGKQTILNKNNLVSVIRQNKENLILFQKVIGKWSIVKTLPVKKTWESSISNLFEVFNKVIHNMPLGSSTESFWLYPSKYELEMYRNSENFNVMAQENGIPVSFDTIHGVKGQTHDATLVLETKFSRTMDVKSLINNFSDSGAKRKDNPQSKKFMKQLYVAMSRPKSILCLAVHKDSISGYEEALVKKGWKIKPVGPIET